MWCFSFSNLLIFFFKVFFSFISVLLITLFVIFLLYWKKKFDFYLKVYCRNKVHIFVIKAKKYLRHLGGNNIALRIKHNILFKVDRDTDVSGHSTTNGIVDIDNQRFFFLCDMTCTDVQVVTISEIQLDWNFVIMVFADGLF